MAIIAIEKDRFASDVLEAKGPVLVDFWAPWCGYCRRLSPAVDRMAASIGEQIQVAKLNIDEMPEIAARYKVDTIPTLILFRDGAVVDAVINPPSQDAMEAWLKENGVL